MRRVRLDEALWAIQRPTRRRPNGSRGTASVGFGIAVAAGSGRGRGEEAPDGAAGRCGHGALRLP